MTCNKNIFVMIAAKLLLLINSRSLLQSHCIGNQGKLVVCERTHRPKQKDLEKYYPLKVSECRPTNLSVKEIYCDPCFLRWCVI